MYNLMTKEADWYCLEKANLFGYEFKKTKTQVE